MEITTKTKTLNVFRNFFKIPILEKVLLTVTTNKTPESFFVKLIPNNYQYLPNTYRFIKRNGITFKVDLFDYMGWWIYFGIKDTCRRKLYNLVKKNSIVIDVGANIGETLLNFAKLTQSDGEVHGFEPDALNYRRCSENLQLNNFNNIVLNNLGLGEKAGEYFIKTNTPSNRGGNKISAQYIENNTELINIIPLDQYVSDKKLNKIDLVKIDVEGYELHVLKGSELLIKKFKPVFFIELDDSNLKEQGNSAKELITYLTQFNYHITNAETDEVITADNDFRNCHYDIICKPF